MIKENIYYNGAWRFGSSSSGRALQDAPASEPSAEDSRLLAKLKSTPDLLALCNKSSSELQISPGAPPPGGEQSPAISSSSTGLKQNVDDMADSLLVGRSGVRENTKATKRKKETPSLKQRPAAAESAPGPAKCLRRPAAAAGHAAAVTKRGYKDPPFPGVPRARRDSEVIEGAKHAFTLYTDMSKSAWRLIKHGQLNDRSASFAKDKPRESWAKICDLLAGRIAWD